MQVTLHYDDYYNFSEKVAEHGIPDTDFAYQHFKYPPRPKITFEWDEDTGDFTPLSMEMNGETYPLVSQQTLSLLAAESAAIMSSPEFDAAYSVEEAVEEAYNVLDK